LTPSRASARLAEPVGDVFNNLFKEFQMAMIYKGKVSIFRNTKGQITVKRDDEGNFSADNADELYNKMMEFGKKLKAEVKAFKPDANGNTPVLLSDRYGNPYIALLVESKAPSKVKVTKLA
jgi:hypothetical protein